MSKRLVAVTAISLLGLGLVSCSSTPDYTDCAPGGPNSDLITITGEHGALLSADYPFPLKGTESESKLIYAGEGNQLKQNQIFSVKMTAFNGATGKPLYKEGSAEAKLSYFILSKDRMTESGLGTFYPVLSCAPIGSRILSTVPAADAVAEGTRKALGLADDDLIVYAIDTIDALLPKADGNEKLVTNTLVPSVSYAPDGTPGLTFRDTAAPTEFTEIVLKDGKHEAIAAGDRVAIHYSIFDWSSKRLTSSTWQSINPGLLSIGDNTNPLIPDESILKYPVGSQLMLVTPDKSGGATIVIVDILGKVIAQ